MTTVMPIDRATLHRTATSAGARNVTVEVLSATLAARDTVTFALALPGTRRAPASYRPGQFITLAFPGEQGATRYRSYSLCGDGRVDAPWEITVKRTPGGKISNFLIDHVRPGAMIRASLPQGTFTLPDAIRPGQPLVFVAGGSGITPIYALLRGIGRLDPARRPHVWLHYAYHGPEDVIFGRELAALDPEGAWLTQYHYVTTDGRRLDTARVVAAMDAQAPNAHWYVCGPSGLKRSLYAEAARLGIPEARLHAEVFASPAACTVPAAKTSAAVNVRLADSGAVLATQPGETLLETLERCGYRPDFSCRAGACGTCRLRLVAGEVRGGQGESGALTPAERAQGHILSCVAQPRGDVILASAGLPVATPLAGGAKGPRTASWPRARKRLRLSLAAAALAVFGTMYGLTSHKIASTASTTTSSSSSSTKGSSSSSSSTSSGSSSSNGSSSVTTTPSNSSTSTSTGVS